MLSLRAPGPPAGPPVELHGLRRSSPSWRSLAYVHRRSILQLRRIKAAPPSVPVPPPFPISSGGLLVSHQILTGLARPNLGLGLTMLSIGVSKRRLHTRISSSAQELRDQRPKPISPRCWMPSHLHPRPARLRTPLRVRNGGRLPRSGPSHRYRGHIRSITHRIQGHSHILDKTIISLSHENAAACQAGRSCCSSSPSF